MSSILRKTCKDTKKIVVPFYCAAVNSGKIGLYPAEKSVRNCQLKFPWDWRTMIHQNVVPTASINDDTCVIYGKLSKVNFNVLLFSNRREKILKSIKISSTQLYIQTTFKDQIK